MKAGTSTLHRLLSSHPEIFMSEAKEPAFFADPAALLADSRLVSSHGFAGDELKYLDLFKHSDAVRYRGESSTHYTKRPRITNVAERMVAFSPGSHIIYVVRDPIERALSHYLHAVRNKMEWRECSQAIRANPFYIKVSEYAYQITPFVSLFGQDRVKLVCFEEMVSEPASVVADLFRWLDVDDRVVDCSTLPHKNRTPETVLLPRGPVSHRAYRAAMSAKRFGPRAKKLSKRTAKLLTREIGKDEIREPDVIEYLRDALDPTVELLQDMFDLEFPRWSW